MPTTRAALILCFSIGFSRLALAFSDSIPTSGDTFVSSANPSTNYGSMGAMQVAAPGLPKGEMQSLLQFNFSSAVTAFNSQFGVGNWTVDSITLQLGTNFGTQGQTPMNNTFNNISGGLFNIDLLANNSWSESTATWNSLSSIETPGSDATLTNASSPGNPFSYTAVGNTNPPTVPAATYGIGLNASLVSDISTGGTASLRIYAADTSVSYLFNSKEFGTAANRPVLVVDAVPEPGSIPLLAIAAFTAVAGRRRRRR